MKKIIETTQLEFTKSNFLIDLIKHNNNKLYIEIKQTINEDYRKSQSIKINPTVLSNLIKVLQNYQTKISTKYNQTNNHITEIEQQKIQERYLKGVPITDLSLQFDITTELIEMILRNRDIEIVSNELPKLEPPKKRYKRWKR
ncbi:hypothetical protein [uncultured Lutibacter sp.]|uniref:hypothetical protein n=1 Tax=uncultured Lutibacter sp. TaxID=437739 RepID=UPI002634FACB|nr:hypothetical protein [uncultured Lutibacter sp.]